LSFAIVLGSEKRDSYVVDGEDSRDFGKKQCEMKASVRVVTIHRYPLPACFDFEAV